MLTAALEFASAVTWKGDSTEAPFAGAQMESVLFAPPPQLADVITVTVAFADLVLSASLVAVIVCVPVVPGAVYKPELLIAPTVVFPPLVPSTDHVTLVSEDPETVALNCCTPPVATVAEGGLRLTETAPPPPPPPEVPTVKLSGVDLMYFPVESTSIKVAACDPVASGTLALIVAPA